MGLFVATSTNLQNDLRNKKLDETESAEGQGH